MPEAWLRRREPCNCCTIMRGAERISLTQAARMMIETEELKPKQRQALPRFPRRSRPMDEGSSSRSRKANWPKQFWRNPATPTCGRRTARRRRQGRLENLKELVRAMDEFPQPRRVPRTYFAGDGYRQCGFRRACLDHDAARRQGSRIRDGVFARLGGRPVSASALA